MTGTDSPVRTVASSSVEVDARLLGYIYLRSRLDARAEAMLIEAIPFSVPGAMK